MKQNLPVLDIYFLEPYDTGSHARWMREFAANSRHQITILGLEGQFWQWRLLGGAITLAERYKEINCKPDLIIASDMLDLSTFVALAKPECPLAVYFHENQLLYPRGPRQKLQTHYAFINYSSALIADAVLFNSHFHRDAFLDELPRLLKHFPDHQNLETVERIAEKSLVLPVGVDLTRFDTYALKVKQTEEKPLVIWNHRWDFDKNPDLFVAVVTSLYEDSKPFRLAITGEQFVREPPAFHILRKTFGADAIQLGYVQSFADYAHLLWEADIVVSTAIQEFFGISIVEAVYCQCWPVLPQRMNYPHLIPTNYHKEVLYPSDKQLHHYLAKALQRGRQAPPPDLRKAMQVYDWARLISQYDDTLVIIAEGR